VKLLRLKADGFGPLRGEWKFDANRLSLVVDDNERGKSSLLAALAAGLYGLDDDRRTHRVVTPLDRWRPWDGGAYRLELDLESGNQRLTIKRDFGRGTVEVWNDRGQDVTAEYRAGKDEYPVGQKLLGLDASEFEKCALVRQNELEAVVPGDEKARRISTLHARLENAADTRVGDTNATEALQVLTAAAANYTSRELDSTLSADNAIKRLEVMTGLLEGDVKQLEHDYSQIAAPLEELSKLGEAEKDARGALTMLETERRETLANEVRRQLEVNLRHQTELEKLKAEAAGLEAAAGLPAGAETDLRESVAKLEEAMRSLDALEARRREEQARERGTLHAEAESLGSYVLCTAADADRAVALAAELRRVEEEDTRLRTDVFGLRDTLAGKGYEPERIQTLTARFEKLGEEQNRLLRSQSELALAFQTEVADLERMRTESTEMLRGIDAVRSSRRVPGWILFTLGAGAAIGGGVMLFLKLDTNLAMVLLSGGGIVMVAGGVLLANAAGARKNDRELALRQLSDAQRRINQLRSQRAETEVGLNEMSRAMNYRDPVELMREWSEFTRMMEASAPVRDAHQKMVLLEDRRRAAHDEGRRLLERSGGGDPSPDRLDETAQGIRKLVAVRQKMADTEKSWSWIDDEKKVAEAAATGLSERAVKILASAGITYDPSVPWGPQVEALADRSRGRARHALLTTELIPQAERRVLPDKSRVELENQLQLLESQRAAAPATGVRGAGEIEMESRQRRETLDELQQRREEKREQVQAVYSRFHREHPDKVEQLRRAEQALVRARRFKRAIELARETIQSVAQETHRKWADHLNARVAELLAGVGAGIEQVRFGEDLDFSVTVPGGQQMARGRAVQTLSAGARDQLHLAVRLAVSEYLSRGRDPLPLLIDDAFATSDDTRTRLGVKLLLEHFSKQHQVVLVTCHRNRYESMAREDRALFDERVQWLELGATKSVAAESAAKSE
jgi:DNA repair exonuclease SbcCD ATPase subunit